MSDDRVIASGGYCAPPGYYDLAPRLGPSSVLSDLPIVAARRGGIHYPTPPDPWLTPDRPMMPRIDPTPRLTAVLARGRTAKAEAVERLGFAWSVVRRGVPERYSDPDTWTWPDYDEDDDE